MSLNSNLTWAKEVISQEELRGKRILDIGSRNWDETIYEYLKSSQPDQLIGIDILPGKEVDVIMDVSQITDSFGKNSFDYVFSFESLEHIENWPQAIKNMKAVLRPGGFIVLTTRTLGYPEHGYPDDYWRFESEDMKMIFRDYRIESLVNDSAHHGVYIKAQKLHEPIDLYSLEIHNMKKKERIKYLT